MARQRCAAAESVQEAGVEEEEVEGTLKFLREEVQELSTKLEGIREEINDAMQEISSELADLL